jgi:hypothetical protein
VRLALALPEATEGEHFDTPDFRVRKKSFAALPKDGRTVALKSTPSNVDALVSTDAATFEDLWRGRWVGVSRTQSANPAAAAGQGSARRRLLNEH